MRRSTITTPVALVLLIALGCASAETTAYQAAGTLAATVEAARQTYVALWNAGKITPATQKSVETAYGDYQKAMAVLQAAITAYKTAGGASSAIDTALVTLQAAAGAFLKVSAGP